MLLCQQDKEVLTYSGHHSAFYLPGQLGNTKLVNEKNTHEAKTTPQTCVENSIKLVRLPQDKQIHKITELENS